jgi:hypothetical protein
MHRGPERRQSIRLVRSNAPPLDMIHCVIDEAHVGFKAWLQRHRPMHRESWCHHFQPFSLIRRLRTAREAPQPRVSGAPS